MRVASPWMFSSRPKAAKLTHAGGPFRGPPRYARHHASHFASAAPITNNVSDAITSIRNNAELHCDFNDSILNSFGQHGIIHIWLCT